MDADELSQLRCHQKGYSTYQALSFSRCSRNSTDYRAHGIAYLKCVGKLDENNDAVFLPASTTFLQLYKSGRPRTIWDKSDEWAREYKKKCNGWFRQRFKPGC